jgi:hypothetical protein
MRRICTELYQYRSVPTPNLQKLNRGCSRFLLGSLWLTHSDEENKVFQRRPEISIHPLKALPIGSPNRARWMGIGPRSGLWHRKTGHAGRKVRSLPPVQEVNSPAPAKDFPLLVHADSESTRGAPALRKRPLKLDKW